MTIIFYNILAVLTNINTNEAAALSKENNCIPGHWGEADTQGRSIHASFARMWSFVLGVKTIKR